jgi:hypothetical protein
MIKLIFFIREVLSGPKESDGPSQWFNKYGELQAKGSYKGGKQHGPWEVYHETGHLAFKGTFKNGERDGPWELYYEDGRVKIKGNSREGRPDGQFERYYDNGQLWERLTYKDGEPEGPFEKFYESGRSAKGATRTANRTALGTTTGSKLKRRGLQDGRETSVGVLRGAPLNGQASDSFPQARDFCSSSRRLFRTPSHSSASGGGGLPLGSLGQAADSSAFSWMKGRWSLGTSRSSTMAPTMQAGTQMAQSMHSSGLITRKLGPS